MIFGAAEFAANGTGQRYLAIKLNGASFGALVRQGVNAAANPTDLAVTTVYQLAVNDYVTLEVFQDSGGALNVVAASPASPEFGMVRVG